MNKNLSKPIFAPGIVHIIIFLIPLAVIAFIVVSNFFPLGRHHSALAQMGELAPDFNLNDFDGNQVKLSDLEGKPVVIQFWDSRCLACLEQLLILEKIQADFPNVKFLGIHVDSSSLESLKRATSLITNNLKITFSQLEDTDAKTYGSYKFDGNSPVTYFIDKSSIVKERFSGLKTEDEIKSQIQKILTE